MKKNKIMQSKILLVISIILIGIGIFKPNLSNNSVVRLTIPSHTNIDKPTDPVLVEACQRVIKAFGSGVDRKNDGIILSNLYSDLAILISLDGEDKIITNTKEISEANAISGSFLKLNLKGKYPELADAAKALVVAAIGEDIVELDQNLRNKAVDAFYALSWACAEGAK